MEVKIMKHSGKIVIKDNRVYFEPDGLEKPDKENYYGYICNPQRPRVKYRRGRLYEKEYQKDMKEYEASKQLIEVSNYWCGYRGIIRMAINEEAERIENNQPCEAEITDKAIITKIN